MLARDHPASPNAGKVLLTGGTGFIASHVLDCLLDHDFEVVVTVRSQEKGQRVLESLDKALRTRTSYVVVEDIAQDGAFDQAVQADPPFDYVIHTASPYKSTFDDPVRDCLEPALKGTTNILMSALLYAPFVKAVVITSSSAAMLSPPNHPALYDESCWADLTWEEGMNPANTYRASKKFAEEAVWYFYQTRNPPFSIATINNTYTFGPVQRTLTSLDEINTSNRRIADMVQGRMRAGIQPTAPVFTFVDVRDVALAHVRAMAAVTGTESMRFYVVGGFFSNPQLASIIRAHFPRLAGRLPPEVEVVDDFPNDHWLYNNSRSRVLLRIVYTQLEKSVVDTVESILRLTGEQEETTDGLASNFQEMAL
ncbi:NAD(P)-binding protein [Parathielavia hyrcaniae]|uniref:NAD(P)-binding protein n=1 Tax=Parathielavia hyrcaniae TaxID=113614 RepID=A0AAN6SYV8_9PEZI|nr:NAD(P)-binding protein [Parathielavia hyrcaniae]